MEKSDESFLFELSKAVNLSYYDYTTLLEDVRNLRAYEWVEIFREKGISEKLLDEYKTRFNVNEDNEEENGPYYANAEYYKDGCWVKCSDRKDFDSYDDAIEYAKSLKERLVTAVKSDDSVDCFDVNVCDYDDVTLESYGYNKVEE